MTDPRTLVAAAVARGGAHHTYNLTARAYHESVEAGVTWSPWVKWEQAAPPPADLYLWYTWPLASQWPTGPYNPAVHTHALEAAQLRKLLPRYAPHGFSFMKPRSVSSPIPAPWRDKLFYAAIKLDGNRALWDGVNGRLFSKNLVMHVPPKAWRDQMPRNVILDGELYKPPGDLGHVSRTWTMRDPPEAHWMAMQFVAFDLPMRDRSMRYRAHLLQRLCRVGALVTTPTFRVSPTIAVVPGAQLVAYAETQRQPGREGVVFRDVDSLYAFQVSPSVAWLKYKFYDDYEGRIVGYVPSPGHGYEVELLGRGMRRVQYSTVPRAQLPIGTVVNVKAWFSEASGLRDYLIRALVPGAGSAQAQWERLTREYTEARAAAAAT